MAAAWVTCPYRDALRGLGSCEGTARAKGALGSSWSLVNNNLKENDMTQLQMQGLCGERGWQERLFHALGRTPCLEKGGSEGPHSYGWSRTSLSGVPAEPSPGRGAGGTGLFPAPCPELCWCPHPPLWAPPRRALGWHVPFLSDTSSSA